MDKQEYLSNEYLKYLGSMDKEGVMDAITPLIKRLSSYTLEKIIKINNAGIEPYYLANKEELLKKLFQIETVEMSGWVSESYHGDYDYERSLDGKDASFFTNVVLLLVALYDQGKKEEACKIAKKLYAIDFDCGYHNEYNDYVEYETYSIEDVYNELECKDITNRVKDIYKESLTYFDDTSKPIN